MILESIPVPGSLPNEKRGPLMKSSLRILVATGVAACLLGIGTRAEAQATMAAISTKMTGVVGDLAKPDTGPPVQDRQKTIVRDLDELIASLERECEACRNGMKRNNPRNGMADSMISRGTGGVGALVDPRQSEKDWAKLSSRERDRILQSMSEGFPPEYRQVLERYYRRLAEEKTASSSGGDQARAEGRGDPGGAGPERDGPEVPDRSLARASPRQTTASEGMRCTARFCC